MLNKTIATKENLHSVMLTDNEKDLIDIIRSVKCANIEVYVQDYIPLRIGKLRENITLGNHNNGSKNN